MEQSFWQQRYETHETGWDLGTISPPLKAYFDQINNKQLRILIPGCGYAHEARYLAEQDFTNVTVLDLVADAIKTIQVDFPAIQTVVGDFFEHQQTYDIIIEQTLFCAIRPERRQEYIQQVYQLLNPNGKYVGVLFNRDFPSGPPFGGSKEEYETYLNPIFSDFQLEPCYNSISPRAGSELFILAKK